MLLTYLVRICKICPRQLSSGNIGTKCRYWHLETHNLKGKCSRFGKGCHHLHRKKLLGIEYLHNKRTNGGPSTMNEIQFIQRCKRGETKYQPLEDSFDILHLLDDEQSDLDWFDLSKHTSEQLLNCQVYGHTWSELSCWPKCRCPKMINKLFWYLHRRWGRRIDDTMRKRVCLLILFEEEEVSA